MAMKRVVLAIDGMTCINCQNKIEKKLNKTVGLTKVKVSYSKGTAEFSYDPDKISIERISDIIINLGYSVIDKKKQRKVAAISAAGILSIIAMLYVLLQRSGFLNMLVPAKLADSGMGYGMLFVVGLLTSVHCIAMCGGINLSQSILYDNSKNTVLAPVLYNAGRVISYTGIGFVLGLIGMLATGGSGAEVPVFLQGILKIVAGTIMIIMGINILGVIPGLRRFQIRIPTSISRKILGARQNETRPLFVGLLNGLMPCGPLQSMQIIALGSGDPVAGALSMFVFSLGTVPLMLGLGSFISSVGKKHTKAVMNVGGVFVVVLGLAMFTQGGALAAQMPFIGNQSWQMADSPEGYVAGDDFSNNTDDSKDAKVSSDILEEGDVQIVESNLELGYYPEITVYSGVPVKWTINASERSINGCNYRMILGEYGIVHDFVPGENVIEFTPGEPGTVQYSCWMGMVYGKINVI